jgi:16S rRNA (guanine527-N7)-methyltransferase
LLLDARSFHIRAAQKRGLETELPQNSGVPSGSAARIAERASRAGISVEQPITEQLDAYLRLLVRWNTRINLTALKVDPPTDEALDRLLVEPLVAARQVLAEDRLAIDVGSGGGSPAIPMKIAAPALRMVLVESRVRKCAFLREAVRELRLTAVEVENERLETLVARSDFRGAADLVSLRAVALSDELWGSIWPLVRHGGRVFWFGGRTDTLPELIRDAISEAIPTPPSSQLLILRLPSA